MFHNKLSQAYSPTTFRRCPDAVISTTEERYNYFLEAYISVWNLITNLASFWMLEITAWLGPKFVVVVFWYQWCSSKLLFFLDHNYCIHSHCRWRASKFVFMLPSPTPCLVYPGYCCGSLLWWKKCFLCFVSEFLGQALVTHGFIFLMLSLIFLTPDLSYEISYYID